MPEPDDALGDIWSHGNFVATAKSKTEGDFAEGKRQLITVEDAEGDCFDIEPGRVSLDDDRYPIYNSDDMKNLPEGLYLGLFHGCMNEDERKEIDDWGESGALIGPVEYVQTTYGSHIKMKFVNSEDSKKYGLPDEVIDEIGINTEGCVIFDGMEYGDWTVFYHKGEEA
jgi:hypothetical protein